MGGGKRVGIGGGVAGGRRAAKVGRGGGRSGREAGGRGGGGGGGGRSGREAGGELSQSWSCLSPALDSMTQHVPIFLDKLSEPVWSPFKSKTEPGQRFSTTGRVPVIQAEDPGVDLQRHIN